jgi:hypothetical protein
LTKTFDEVVGSAANRGADRNFRQIGHDRADLVQRGEARYISLEQRREDDLAGLAQCNADRPFWASLVLGGLKPRLQQAFDRGPIDGLLAQAFKISPELRPALVPGLKCASQPG